MNRNRKNKTKLDFQKLEARQVLAGNITAAIGGGHLYVAGDNLANEVRIFTDEQGRVNVAGINTTVNGGEGPFVATSGAGQQIDNITIRLYDGNDQLTIDGLAIQDLLNIDTLSGNDTVSFNNLRAEDVFLDTGGEDDIVAVISADITKEFEFHAKTGNDTFAASDMNVGRKTYINLGIGNDQGMITGQTNSNKLTADLGAGNDFFGITPGQTDQSASFDRRVKIHGKAGDDVVSLDSSTDIRRLLAEGNEGNDTLDLGGAFIRSDRIDTFETVGTTNVSSRISDIVNALAAAGIDTQSFGGDPVQVTASTSDLTFTENDSATAIDNGFSITGQAGREIDSASVQISGYVNGEDSLTFNDTSNITGNFNATTGVLTLAGSASIEDYQAALRSVQYVNDSEDPTTSDRTFEFSVVAGDETLTALRVLSITSVNDSPELSLDETSIQVNADNLPIQLDNQLTITDVDSTTLVSATVSITSGFVSTEDSLSFTAQNGITGTYSATTGILTLTGTASLADYIDVLRSVTYDNSAEVPTDGTRTITFAVNDGDADADDSLDLTVNVERNVDVGVADDALTFNQGDTPLVIDNDVKLNSTTGQITGATVSITNGFATGEDILEATASDSITASYDSASGVLTLSGTASVADYLAVLNTITYENTSNQPSIATRTLVFTVNDGSATSSDQINVNVVANASPVVDLNGGENGNDFAATFTEGDGPVTIVSSVMSVIDQDSANLTGATIQITNLLDGTAESLSVDVSDSGLIATYDDTTGILTLTGEAAVEEYEKVLRTLSYDNTSETATETDRTIEVTVTDGINTSDVATSTVSVIEIDPKPAIDLNGDQAGTGFEATFTPGGDPVSIVRDTLTVVDEDSLTLQGAVARITNLLDSTAESLAVTVGSTGITATYDDQTGTLTLSGSATLDVYQQVLATLTYGNSSTDPDTTARTVEVTINDGNEDSEIATSTVNFATT